MRADGTPAIAARPAVDDRLEQVAAALRSHNIEAIIVDTGDDAILGVIAVSIVYGHLVIAPF